MITLDELIITQLPKSATLLRVIDGDTISVAVYFQNTQAKLTCRFSGINAPEMNTPEGVLAKSALESVATHQLELEYEPKRDKYGRHLVTVYANGLNLNMWMINNKHAQLY